MKKALLVFILFSASILLLPGKVFAHVKWFTDVMPNKESMTNILSPFFMSLAIITSLLLALLTQILPMITRSKLSQKVDRWLDQLRKYSTLLLKYGTAGAILLQILSGTIFVPEFEIEHSYETIFLWISVILLVIPHHW